MSTDIRAEISKKNTYYISVHKFYELRHMVMQYPEWKQAYASINALNSPRLNGLRVNDNEFQDPTAEEAESKVYYKTLIDMVEQAAKKADPDLAYILIQGVIDNMTFEKLQARYNFICSRGHYYKAYRRFFYFLANSQKKYIVL